MTLPARRRLSALSFVFLAFLIAVSCSKSREAEQSILVLGGTRNTGFETVKLLLDEGHDVTVMVRETSDLSNLNTTNAAIVVGDAFDVASLQSVFDAKTYDAVISTLSARPVNGQFVGGIGNINAMNAASEAGVRRFVLVSSLGVGDSLSAVTDEIAATSMKPYFEAKGRAEARLRQGDFEYTIIRPGGLVDGPATGSGVLKEQAEYGQVSRGEVARLLLLSLQDDSTIGKTYHLIDRPFLNRSE